MLRKAENWPPPVSSISSPAAFSLLGFFGCIYTSNKSKLRYLAVKNEQRHWRTFVNQDRGQGLVLSYHIIHDSTFSVSLTSPSPRKGPPPPLSSQDSQVCGDCVCFSTYGIKNSGTYRDKLSKLHHPFCVKRKMPAAS